MNYFKNNNDENSKKKISKLENSPMRNFYRGKTILLTGCLGFLGQLFLEKLLRSDVKMVYVIIRPKKSTSPLNRLKSILKEPQFDKLRQYDPNYFDRIRIIEGDITEKLMGLTDIELNDIYNNINIVIHAAADVRMDAKLSSLIISNVKATREILRIAEKIKKLEVFSYISTAFSNSYLCNIKEKFYEPPMDPNKIIDLYEKSNENEFDNINTLSVNFTRPWPNNYVFSKCLAEDLVRQYGKKFPVCVLRPSIVISTYKDPLPGWCYSIAGHIGVTVGVGIGLIRTICLGKHYVANVISADLVINTTLAAIWNTHTEQMKLKQNTNLLIKKQENQLEIIEPEVFNICSCLDKPVTWIQLQNASTECAYKIESKTFFPVFFKPTINKALFFYYTLILHFLPAFIVEKIQPSSKYMMKQRLTQRFLLIIRYFCTREFIFDNTNYKRLMDKMTPEDQSFYVSDIRNFDFDIFKVSYVKYVTKIMMATFKDNKMSNNHLRMFYIMLLIIFYGFHSVLFYFITNYYNIINYKYLLNM
ncbi:fatty acyl-CoA reductase wat-like [Condylostylus longicornis]|uniref:fatty acyl-CoA reductase wat-like n=1 Tax=Condylostylus longicornis TaxID=2530218 RepID=UPI00244DF56B|nr:fatty acyl-CoA reductase wat-like [Condylostylus longicornis]